MPYDTITSVTDDVHDNLATYHNQMKTAIDKLMSAAAYADYVRTQSMTGNVTLTDSDFPIQSFSPTAARVLTLPAVAVTNHAFYVVNRSGTYAITVKNASAAIITIISAGQSVLLISDGANNWYAVSASSSGGGQAGGMLTLQSGVAVPLSDITAATSIYLTPYKGTKLPRYSGSEMAFEDFSTEITITLNATPHPANTTHDVFYFDDGGTKRIGSVKWRNSGQAITAATNANPCVITSNSHGIQNGDIVEVYLRFASATFRGQYTASSVATNTITFTAINSTASGAFVEGYIQARGVGSATSELELQNGYLVNKNQITAYYSASGATVAAKYGTYIGTFRITGTNAQCEDSVSKRFIWNYYNQTEKQLALSENTTHTYTTSSYRYWNNSSANRVEFVVGVQENSIWSYQNLRFDCTAGESVLSSIGYDTYSTTSALSAARIIATDIGGGGVGTIFTVQPSAGYHYLAMVEYGDATSGDYILGFLLALIKG